LQGHQRLEDEIGGQIAQAVSEFFSKWESCARLCHRFLPTFTSGRESCETLFQSVERPRVVIAAALPEYFPRFFAGLAVAFIR
jgi:hypothetical protein